MTFELKKPYTAPQVTVHGDVEKITLSGALMNADTPSGSASTAFPVASPVAPVAS